MSKIVILTNGNYFARRMISAILRVSTYKVSHIIEIKGDYYGRTGIQAAWALLRKMAFPFFVFKLFVHVFSKVCDAELCMPRRVQVGQVQRRSVTRTSVDSLQDRAVREILEEVRPELLVSVSCPQKISGALLSLAKYGGINIHSSLLPAYAGLAPYFWVLANGEQITGTTVHWMTEKWDDGNILVQKRASIPAGQSVFQLFRALALLGSIALAEGIELALTGTEGTQQDRSRRSYFSHPTTRACKELKKHGHCLMRISDSIDLWHDFMSF